MNKQTTEELGLEKDKIVEGIMKQKAEIIDLFVKTFIVTEVKDLENFRTGMLELVCGTENVGMSMQSTYKCVFIPLDEYEELKGKVVKRKELEQARRAAKREAIEEVAEMLEAQKTGHKLGEREICIECIDRMQSKLTL
jgi:hypothetical protein